MANQWGPHGAAVERLFEEVRTADPGRWQDFFAHGAANRADVEASAALPEDPSMESALFAVDVAADDVVRSLPIWSGDDVTKMEKLLLLTRVKTAAKVVALGNDAPDEPRRILLRPFTAAGFQFAAGLD